MRNSELAGRIWNVMKEDIPIRRWPEAAQRLVIFFMRELDVKDWEEDEEGLKLFEFAYTPHRDSDHYI